MLNLRVAAYRLTFLALFAAAACGDDGGAPGTPSGMDPEDSSTPRDAGVDADAEPSADAETLEEAGVVPDGGTLSECEGTKLEFRVANGEGRPFATAIRGNRTHLVYMVPSGGRPYHDARFQGLAYTTFGTTGEADASQNIVNVDPTISFKTRDPALVIRDEQVDLFYTSNANEEYQYELYYKDLTANGTPQRKTNNMGRNEFSSSATRFAGQSAVVFSDGQDKASSPSAVGFLRAAGGTPQTIVPQSDRNAAQLAVLGVGPDDAPAGAFAFVSDLDAMSGRAGIFVQALSSTGEPQGALRTLSTQIGGRSQVAMAKGRTGGALIYTEAPGGVRHQLRFVQLDESGVAGSDVRTLTTGDEDLRDIAIASYSQGYVIAFRTLGGPAGPTIQLMFVDAQGNVGGRRLVQAATSSAVGLDVLVANDGRVVVVWADTEMVMNGTQGVFELRVRAARLTCAL